MKINDIHYVHIFGIIEITVSENAIIEKLLKEADMSNDNTKNNKFSLYTEKIIPKKLKKKSKKFIIVLIIIAAGVTALFIVPFIINKVNYMVEVSNSELSLDRDDIQAINLKEISESGNVDNKEAFSKMPQTIENINKSVVYITPKDTDLIGYILPDGNRAENETISPGSGLIIGETATRYVIMSGNLSIDKGQHVDVTVGGDVISGTFLAKSPNLNIALVSIKKKDLSDNAKRNIVPIKLGNSNRAPLGSFVISYGGSGDESGTYNYGIISKKYNLSIIDANLTMINTNIVSSVSKGGFLFDSNGNLLGIGTDKGSGSNTFNVVGISDIKRLIEKLSADIDIVLFGIYGEDITESIADKYGVPNGVYITDVEFDSPAYKAGLQSGDIITAIDGDEIKNIDDIENILSSYKAGKTISVDIKRKNKDGYFDMSFDVNTVRYKL